MKVQLFFYFPVIFVAYLIFARIKYGMTRSISSSYKLLTRWEKILPMVVLWLGISLPVIVLGLEVSKNSNFQFLWFISSFLIALVGAAPVTVSESLAERVHVFGATGGMAVATAAVVFSLPGLWSYILAGLFILFTITQTVKKLNLKLKNNTYWIEVAAVAMTWLALFIYFQTHKL